MGMRDISAYTRPRYIESDYSIKLFVGILKKPSLTLDTNNKLRLQWTNLDPNTQLYELQYSYNSGAWELYDNPTRDNTTYDLPDTLKDGTYKFRVRATATILDDNYDPHDFYSPWSNETQTITVKTLKQCVVESIGRTSQYYLSNIDDDADYYLFRITKDNAKTETVRYDKGKLPSASDPLILDYYTPGVYVITATAYNNNEYLFHNATSSNSKTYTVIKLATPELFDVDFTHDNPIVNWNAITNANAYKIFLNKQVVNSAYTGLTYNFRNDLKPEILNYSAQISAIRTMQEKYPDVRYIESNLSNEIKFGTLPQPILTLATEPERDGTILVVNKDEYENADKFQIYNVVGGEYINFAYIPATTFEYELDGTRGPITYNIKFKATSRSKNIIDSVLSDVITFSFIKLPKPRNLRVVGVVGENTTIEWTPAQGAEFYDVYINGAPKYTNIRNTKITIKLPINRNEIYVVARHSLRRYLPSDPSNVIIETVRPNSQYIVKVNNEAFNMVLPFSFNTTLDESMDTATAITSPIDRKEPFEAFSEVEITANQYWYDDTKDEMVFVPMPGFPKSLILAQDDVKEVQIGEGCKYQHNLNLIERTKLLETELMPDFSITQPMEYAQKINEINPELIVPDYGGYSILNDEKYLRIGFKNNSWEYYPGSDWAKAWFDKFYYVTGLKEEAIKGSLNSLYHVGDRIGLPYETANDFTIYIYKTQTILHAANYQNYLSSYNNYNVSINRIYKYRKHSESYDVDPSCPESIITQTTSSTQQYWDTKDIPVGEYDIILEMEIPDEDWNDLKGKIYYDGNSKLEFMYNTEIPEANLTSKNPPAYDLSQLHKLRIVYGSKSFGINITKLPAAAVKPIPWDHKNVWQSMNKAINLLYPLVYGKDPKYKLDPKLKYLESIPSPELKFQNGKSLYEVLLTFGRLFYGIPRLGCLDENNIYRKNWITFDILDSDKILEANNEYEDVNTEEGIVSSIDNHNTGYISNISNMITNEQYAEFPSGDLWISPRSGSDDDPLANKDNMAIVLDRNIYRLVSVKVKNYDKAHPENELDIKNYVDEETIFQSLNNDAEGKGLSIYYKQGDNKILGLGNIPQASRTQAAWGLDPDEYIIQRIITRATGGLGKSAQNNPNDFLYKIVYVPYIDSRVFVEQTNIAGVEHTTYKNLNQEDNVIFDKYFGKSAQTQVERLGNNSIKKVFRNLDMIKLPMLGQIKKFNGYNYYADEITYIFNNNYIDCEANFSKNFNKINERIGIDANYRLFKIFSDQYIIRDININRYVYVSKDRYDEEAESMKRTEYNLVSNFKNALNDGNNKCSPHIKPDAFYIRNFKNNSELLKYQDFKGDLIDVPCSLLSVGYNVFSNSILFTGRFLDNFSAGIQTENVVNTSLIKDQRIQKDVRYVDNNGEDPVMGITLCNLDDKVKTNPFKYPEADFEPNPKTFNNAIFSEKILLDKDNKESIGLSYQIHMQTYDKDISIHRGLLRRIYTDKYRMDISDKEASPKYCFYTGDISKQEKVTAQYQKSNFITLVSSGNTLTINANHTITADRDYDGYALVFQDGSIAYNIKQKIKKGDSFSIPVIYFNFTDDKISYKQK